MFLYPSQQINRKLPENYQHGELDFCKTEFSYNTHNVELLTFKNCYVNFFGNLYTSALKLVEVSLVAPSIFRNRSWFRFLKKVIIKPKRKLANDEKYLLAFDQWSNNHYHWINDYLPRLTLLASELQNYTLLLPDEPYIRNVGVKLLDYLNLKPRRIEWIGRGKFVKAPDLTLITSVVLSGQVHDELIKQVQNRLSDTLLSGNLNASRRIYISRTKASNRKVLNEAEVISLLKEYDFEVVAFEDLSIEQQIQLANTTSVMISMHGAGLTNAIFMKKNTAVLEFRRDKVYHNQCYWHLSAALGQKYYYLFGQPDSDNVIEGAPGCNLTIPLSKLRLTVEQMLKDQQTN
ncbi:glycosyltransferase family 61 protein [Mucilaginibacter sp.]